MHIVSETKDNMTGLCEVGTTIFELQSSRVFNSTFEIHPSSFAPSLPDQPFYRTQMPGCLWFLAKSMNVGEALAA